MDDELSELTYHPYWLNYVTEHINHLELQMNITKAVAVLLMMTVVILAVRRRWPQKVMVFFAYLMARSMVLEGEDWQSLTLRAVESHSKVKHENLLELPDIENPFKKRQQESPEE